MKKTILTIFLTIVVIFGGFYIYISSGAYDISQLTPHNNLTKNLIQTTTKNSIKKRMKENEVPVNIKDTEMLVTGFKLFKDMCAGCHGTPGVKKEEMPQGWYPKPPMLFKFAKEEDAQEFFWITKNGIKMTAMPAYKPLLSDQQIWAIVAFTTQKLSKMSPDEYKEWMAKYSVTDGSH